MPRGRCRQTAIEKLIRFAWDYEADFLPPVTIKMDNDFSALIKSLTANRHRLAFSISKKYFFAPKET